MSTLLLRGLANFCNAGLRAIEGSLGALWCIIVADKGIGSIDGNGSAMKIAGYGGDTGLSPMERGILNYRHQNQYILFQQSCVSSQYEKIVLISFRDLGMRICELRVKNRSTNKMQQVMMRVSYLRRKVNFALNPDVQGSNPCESNA